ncbi:DUF2306 domain-containing protein [Arthrobacter sulfonylureivorans]|uniref:DUF2306 domain-containing protein n=1 Tax=Arthrobacter sulfonylureivorans TaxID=2486855 RepID=A0ABY3W754_9MICC|nr:DUF2306 domain-containing protein [Arthrobacter sulfonylureivorans]UNK46105.1 DUF2306 domain-containing protein [Arthrobacter sulfonylureivorans]
MKTEARRRQTRRKPALWGVPTGLILLSLTPILGGAMRLAELAGGAEITSHNERFFESPVPVSLHIISATVYSLLGAFQFVPALRGRRWHRIAGRILVPAGLAAALSGLWMAVFYSHSADSGAALLFLRLIIGFSMVSSIVLGLFYAIRRRDLVRHSAWMTRAYAIGAAAGTEALIIIGPEILAGQPGIRFQVLITGAAAVINVTVAEYVIHRRARAAARIETEQLATEALVEPTYVGRHILNHR